MNFRELKELTLFQLGMDKEDEKELQPQLNRYLNEGHTLLNIMRYRFDCDELRKDTQVPELPDWMHQAIADWACYRFCVCSGRKQEQRLAFYKAFDAVRIRAMSGKKRRFINWE